MNELRHAHEQLVRAQKTLARATPGSRGRTRAKARLNRLHRRVANQRHHHAHQVSSWVMKNCTRVYVCAHCDLVIDRDHNAGVNLARWTRSVTPVST
ncbi:MAG: transposase [Acidobacteria bacterium]|nr:transposase [Acidobacteriota bacterium]